MTEIKPFTLSPGQIIRRRELHKTFGGQTQGGISTPSSGQLVILISGDSRYGKQLVEDVKYRKRWAEKVGLGFELPQALETEFDVNCATCATNPDGHDCTANA
jgi:hypothetical protein